MPLAVGVVLAVIGLPLLLAGAGLGWTLATQRDDGFFSTSAEQLSTPTVALASEVLELGQAGPDDWWADHDLATVRLNARSAGPDVFVGIAPSAAVEAYLGTTSYDEISDLRTDPFFVVLTILAFVALMTDTYPPFRLDQGPTEPDPRRGPQPDASPSAAPS